MSRRVTYGIGKCPFCERNITNSGAARVSHLRSHVRAGIAVELGRNRFGWIEFAPAKPA